MPASKKGSKKKNYPVNLVCVKCSKDQGKKMRTKNAGKVVQKNMRVKGTLRPYQTCKCAECGTKKFRFIRMSMKK